MRDPKFLDVAGTRTRYFEAGAGEPVVLVHGGQFGSYNCATDWDQNFGELADGFRVIAYDKIGQGWSGNPTSPSAYVLETAVEHLERVVETLAPGGAHLVGHSRGGYAVTRLALDRPELVRSLVLVDPGSLMHRTSGFYPAVEARAAAISDGRERLRFEIAEASFERSMATDFWVEDILAFIETEKYVEARRICAEQQEALTDQLVQSQHETWAAISAGALVQLPVLLVWGYNDRGAPIEECGIPALHQLMAAVPQARMHVFNQSGHYAFREHPAEFNQVVRAFISRSRLSRS
jgi:pimeloyl-ACP methyl ester carboxylesterase